MSLTQSLYRKLFLIALVVAALLPLLAWAQAERNSDRTGETDVTVEQASLNADTNVCDGATCSDGSCAPTPAACGEEEMMADSVCNGFVCDTGECVSSAAICGLDVESLPSAPAICSADANVRCGDGSCTTAPDKCGPYEEVALAVDGVCNGFVCDTGECATSEAMCAVLDDVVAPVSDSVCSDYLCDSGECVSDELWCGMDFDFEVDPSVAADSVCNGFLCNDGTCASSEVMCEMNFDEIEMSVAKCPAGSPIRCGDGSCSDNVEQCRAIEARISTPAGEAEVGASGRAQNHNSSRSNRTEGVAVGEEDMDSDGDGLDDGSQRAQDYNAARSNKPSRSMFSDTDADGRPEVSLRAGEFVRLEAEGEAAAGDGAGGGAGRVKCWARAESEDGQVYAWGRGICIAEAAAENATSTAREQLAALQVRGDEVRGWSEEERSAWEEYRSSRATSSPAERLAEHLVEQTQADERIKEIRTDSEGAEMRYQAQLRLFGLIPMEREVTARAATNGTVEIDYPWYRFLSSAPDTQNMTEVMNGTIEILMTMTADPI